MRAGINRAYSCFFSTLSCSYRPKFITIKIIKLQSQQTALIYEQPPELLMLHLAMPPRRKHAAQKGATKLHFGTLPVHTAVLSPIPVAQYYERVRNTESIMMFTMGHLLKKLLVTSIPSLTRGVGEIPGPFGKMIVLAGFGNPLLDVTVKIDNDGLLKKYSLNRDDQKEIPLQEMQNLLKDVSECGLRLCLRKRPTVMLILDINNNTTQVAAFKIR